MCFLHRSYVILFLLIFSLSAYADFLSQKTDLDLTTPAEKNDLILSTNYGYLHQTYFKGISKGFSQLRIFLPINFLNDVGVDSLDLTAQTGDDQQSSWVPPYKMYWNTKTVADVSILNKLLDKTVTIIYPNDRYTIQGTLIYWKNNNGILKSNNNESYVFHWSPNLIVKSTYIDMKTETKASDDKNFDIFANFNLPKDASSVNITYINHELTFSKKYKVIFDDEHATLRLDLKAYILNNSQFNYKNTNVILVNNNNQQHAYKLAGAGFTSFARERDAITTREGDVQYIKIKQPISLTPNSSSVINALSYDRIAFKHSYNYTFNQWTGTSNTELSHPRSLVHFKAPNDLPEGEAQFFYAKKQYDQVFYAGNTSVAHIAKNAQVTLDLGSSYLIDIKKEQLSSIKIDKTKLVVNRKFYITNHQNKTVEITISDDDKRLTSFFVYQKAYPHAISIKLDPETTKVLNITSTYI